MEDVRGDLSVSASALDVVLETLEFLGGLNYLVNSAGAPGTRTPIAPSDLDALTAAVAAPPVRRRRRGLRA